MLLTGKEIAKMIDLSCVRTSSDKADIEEMVAAARKYDFGQVSVLQCFIPYTKQLLADRRISMWSGTSASLPGPIPPQLKSSRPKKWWPPAATRSIW